ncbi:MAG: hypothetical protein KIT72_04750 [Polyangiaceae bacterium]|nr:hypothetical protein [Polyangiaceae bacterium]MCW5789713.1 hypothetical protein [Polyangiaceae bacterium]
MRGRGEALKVDSNEQRLLVRCRLTPSPSSARSGGWTGSPWSALGGSLLAALLTVACGAPSPPNTPLPTGGLRERGRDCLRYTVQVASPYHQELGDPVDDPRLDEMPPEARRSARAAGLESLILALLEIKHGRETSDTRRIDLQQKLFVQLMSFETQLQSLLTEVDCTDDVIEDLSARLRSQEDDRELKLTLASIGVAAAATIVGGVWEIADSNSLGPPIVATVGGVGSAGLGVAALIPTQHTIAYHHPHNLLAPIASGEDEARLYPTFVRRLLDTPIAPGKPSPRDELLATFERQIADAYPPSERVRVRELLYGSGAVYDQRLINLREAMYDALESKLAAFARELELLNRYLVRLIGSADTSE